MKGKIKDEGLEERLFNDGWEQKDLRDINNLLSGGWQVSDVHRFMYSTKIINSIDKKVVKVLDIGCSCGRLLQVQQKLARTASTKQMMYVGLDAREECLQKLVEFSKNNLSGSQNDNVFAENLNVVSIDDCKALLKKFGKFDVICMLDVFEHIPKELGNRALKNISNLLSCDGKLVMSTPIHFSKDEEMWWPDAHAYEYTLDEINDIFGKYFTIESHCGNHVIANELKKQLNEESKEVLNLYKNLLKFSKNGIWLNEIFGCYYYKCCKGHIIVCSKGERNV